MFGQHAFKPGDTIDLAATFLTHGRADRVEWKGSSPCDLNHESATVPMFLMRCGWLFNHSRAPARQFASQPVWSLSLTAPGFRNKCRHPIPITHYETPFSYPPQFVLRSPASPSRWPFRSLPAETCSAR